MGFGIGFETFCKQKKISLESIREAVLSDLDLVPGEMCYVSGSLAEDLGNYQSDIDVFVISERSLTAKRVGPAVTLNVENCPIDVEIFSASRLQAAIENLIKINDKCLSDPRHALEISLHDLELLHRFCLGIPLSEAEELISWQRTVDRRWLSRVICNSAVACVTVVQSDLIGLLAEGDFRSATLRSQDLLGLCVDALLAGLGNTNPSRKWRMRLLEKYEEQGALPRGLFFVGGPCSSEWFFSLYCRQILNMNSAYKYALECINAANVIIPWAMSVVNEQCKPNNSTASFSDFPWSTEEDRIGSKRLTDSPFLPFLAIDTKIRLVPEGFELSRLRGDRVFLLNDYAMSLLRCFCANKTLKQAVDSIPFNETNNEARILGLIDDWHSFLRCNDFLASPFGDFTAETGKGFGEFFSKS